MARFIKYTQKSESLSKTLETLIFVNVDHVSKATFKDGELTLIFASGIPLMKHAGDSVKLTGTEAIEALEVIRALS